MTNLPPGEGGIVALTLACLQENKLKLQSVTELPAWAEGAGIYWGHWKAAKS